MSGAARIALRARNALTATGAAAALLQLDDCLDQPCNRYGRCRLAVVGDDPTWDDPDRYSQYVHTPLPDAGPASVTLSGTVVGFATRGGGARAVVVLLSDAATKARYAAMGATYPDAGTGSVFAGAQPGEATVTFGPASTTCVPGLGAWPSTLPNTARVPVAAGFETRVLVQCHR